MPHSLSRDELDRYAGQGFLIVRDVLGDADFAPVEAACERLIDTIARRHLAEGLIASAAEGEGFTTRLARIEEQLTDSEAQVHKRELDIMEARLPEMFAFFFNRNLLAPVESIVGPEITLSPIQHLRPYTPRRGERQPMQVPWHQDQGVTREEADASEILTVWFPLVDVDPHQRLPAGAPRRHRVRPAAARADRRHPHQALPDARRRAVRLHHAPRRPAADERLHPAPRPSEP